MPLLRDISKALGRFANKLKYSWKEYDLWKEINNNPWNRDGNSAVSARKWLNNEVRKDESYHYRAKLMTQGKLYIFDYDTPKYEDILDYFDTQPLVISIGSINTSNGLRDLGINLHLLPPRIRRIVMFRIFEMYRNTYKASMFEKNQKSVPVSWKAIVRPLYKYGIAFAIRMYIPELRTNVIEFRYEDWKNAIYIESKGLSKITFEGLEAEWQKFVKYHKQYGLRESWHRT